MTSEFHAKTVATRAIAAGVGGVLKLAGFERKAKGAWRRVAGAGRVEEVRVRWSRFNSVAEAMRFQLEVEVLGEEQSLHNSEWICVADADAQLSSFFNTAPAALAREILEPIGLYLMYRRWLANGLMQHTVEPPMATPADRERVRALLARTHRYRWQDEGALTVLLTEVTESIVRWLDEPSDDTRGRMLELLSA